MIQKNPVNLSKNTKVFFSLEAQYENLGDEVINAQLLRQVAKRAQLVAYAGASPAWYVDNLLEQIGEYSRDISIERSKVKFLAQVAVSSLRGVRTIMMTSCGDVSSDRPEPKKEFVISLLQKLPGFILAQVGASHTKISPGRAEAFRRAANSFPSITVRDERSLALLRNLGISARLVPDLAFLFAFEHKAVGRTAMFMLREDANLTWNRVKERVASLKQLTDYQGLEAVVSWQVDRDEQLNRRLAKALGMRVIEPPASPINRLIHAQEIYGQTEVIFSNRLHGLLLAASCGAVPVPLLTKEEKKVRAVFEEAKLEDIIVDMGAEDLAAADYLLRSREAVRMRVGAVFSNNSTRIEAYFDHLVGPT